MWDDQRDFRKRAQNRTLHANFSSAQDLQGGEEGAANGNASGKGLLWRDGGNGHCERVRKKRTVSGQAEKGEAHVLRAHLRQVHEVGHQAGVGGALLAGAADLAQVVQRMEGLHLDG